jgi:uncharacterized protein (UPF0371 family)
MEPDGMILTGKKTEELGEKSAAVLLAQHKSHMD